jgi:OFA family oxalate/formate antiporter-like MFS transporter
MPNVSRWYFLDERARAGWVVVAGGVLINLMLGVTYTWSVFAGPLAEKFGWSQTEVQLAFSVMLAAFALSMIPAGMLIDRYGPKIVALAGGLLLAIGFAATGLLATTPLSLYATYGLLAGAGVGLAYGTPISAGMKWFERGKGLASGIIVFGFGFGSLLLAPVAKDLIVSQGVQQAFVMLGVVFAAVIGLGALLLRNPPEYRPAAQAGRFEAFGILKSRDFWLLWLMFALSSAAGLMVIGNLATFAKLSFTSVFGMEKDAAFSLAALAVGVLAVFNGAGRIFAGWLSDRIGRPKAMLIFFGVQAFAVASIVAAGSLSAWALLSVMCVVGLCFGANFSLFPSATADRFGTQKSGANYGLVFTAYGVGGIVGPQVMATMLDASASAGGLSVAAYGAPFLIAGALVGAAALLSLWFKHRQAA